MECAKGEGGSIVSIGGSAAFVDIFFHEVKEGQCYWNVKWKIIFAASEQVIGNFIVNTEKLESAFGLRDSFSEEDDIRHSNWMIEQFGGTVAYQGRFIRWKNYLTLPAPAMGHDGTPAVSISLTDPIKEAVRVAIAQRSSA